MTARRGFTLVEVLVSLMVFTIISTAMVGALLMATRLFREGEMARAANDEAMSVLALFERDVEAAVPYAQFGSFYAKIHDSARPDCAVAWTINNPNPIAAIQEPTVVVLWGKDSKGTLRRRILSQFEELDQDDNGRVDDDDPRILLDNGGRLVTDRCRYFGIWLAGTGNLGTPIRQIAVTPEPQSWWSQISADDGSIHAAHPRPSATTAYATDFTNQRMLYPGAIRCYLLMEGKGGIRKEGIVSADDAGTTLRVAGLQGIATMAGSVLVIDSPDPSPPPGLEGYIPFEIVGYHGFSGGNLLVNTLAEHGPLGTDGTGRGAFRTVKTNHRSATGDKVRVCRPFTLVKVLPR